METDRLFEDVGFVGTYQKDLKDFYSQYIENEQELYSFFHSVFENDRMNKSPRRMMNQVQRFVTLSIDIDKIRPESDALRLMFLRTCLESIYHLSGQSRSNAKDFYKDYLETDEKKYILAHFHLCAIEENFDNIPEFTISEFSEVLFILRNSVVHDGNYWVAQVFSHNNIANLSVLSTNRSITDHKNYKETIFYTFETTLKFNIFIRIFSNGCIRFIKQYVNKINNKNI